MCSQLPAAFSLLLLVPSIIVANRNKNKIAKAGKGAEPGLSSRSQYCRAVLRLWYQACLYACLLNCQMTIPKCQMPNANQGSNPGRQNVWPLVRMNDTRLIERDLDRVLSSSFSSIIRTLQAASCNARARKSWVWCEMRMRYEIIWIIWAMSSVLFLFGFQAAATTTDGNSYFLRQ
jgi:hypothetical protein